MIRPSLYRRLEALEKGVSARTDAERLHEETRRARRDSPVARSLTDRIKDTPTNDLGFVHKFVAARSSDPHPVTLLLLDRVGGDESSLLLLGSELWPDAALLGVRGKASLMGMTCLLLDPGYYKEDPKPLGTWSILTLSRRQEISPLFSADHT